MKTKIAPKRKNLDDVTDDMSELFEALKSKTIERADADSLANISGKIIKIAQIKVQVQQMLLSLDQGSEHAKRLSELGI